MLTVVPPWQALELVIPHIKALDKQREAEDVEVSQAVGRVIAQGVECPKDVPHFTRSSVDGYAVRAADTFGASESVPALLRLTGRVEMGRAAGSIEPGCAHEIPTGGMLPQGADAVVMVEHSEQVGSGTVAVYSSVAPGENVLCMGEDFAAGQAVVPEGRRLRPVDVAAIAACGIARVKVYRPLRVAVISTGDELQPPGGELSAGQVYDINGFALCAMIHNDHMVPVFQGIVRDCAEAIATELRRALEECDGVLVTGGTSAGARDVLAGVIDALGEPGVIVHGLAIRPGKPTVLGAVQGKPVLGLAGHPASAMVVYEVVARPLLMHMAGWRKGSNPEVPRLFARLTRPISSRPGREDYVRCLLRSDGTEVLAEPLLGKSGLVSTMVGASAYIKVPFEKEGCAAGEMVEVILSAAATWL
ncbi:MAG: gephyrin-like molybdotransferase Glp [Bacillota bacterium]